VSLHFFAIPALEPTCAQDELNRFCAAHRVVSVERQFVAAGRESFWALCVTVAPGPGTLPAALKAPESRADARAKIDYKEVLNEADFARFADLRVWRKATAEREGVPVYAVFSNEQLAEIVRLRVDTAAALATIEGIGPARVERYGAEVLERLRLFQPAEA
jgi:superfamily II DNA helicase RecQ